MKTIIINQRGDKYQVNLNKYPQAPPVLPSYIYDKYFDQINGIKWYRKADVKSGGGAEFNFIDVITGKEFKCNKKNIELSMGKKVIIDAYFSNYYIDNKGDVICNDNRKFFFDTNKERNDIVKTLQFILNTNSQDLFVFDVGRKKHTFIPGIKINE